MEIGFLRWQSGGHICCQTGIVYGEIHQGVEKIHMQSFDTILPLVTEKMQ